MDDSGQLRPDILFSTRSGGVKVFIGKQGLHYQFSKMENPEVLEKVDDDFGDAGHLDEELKITTYRLDVKLIGANSHPEVVKEEATGYYENYYLAHCPDGITGVKSFDKITLKDVYPGIDWVFYRHGEFMKYDFVLQPGVDPSQIRLKFEGAETLQLLEDGSLKVSTPLGNIREQKPVSFAGDEEVESSFMVEGVVVSFEVSEHSNVGEVLRIDPILEWSLIYGGSSDEAGRDCEVDPSGNVLLVGHTKSGTNISSGGHQNTLNAFKDAFLVKFDNAGNRLWATYYGGEKDDDAYGCATDAMGNIFISGTTASQLAIAHNGHINTAPGWEDAFLVKFSSNGTRLWGTYRGASSSDYGYGCTSDGSNVYLTGSSGGIFLTKYNSSGNILWNFSESGNLTYSKSGYGCTTDADSNIYLAAYARSAQFSDKAILFKLDSSGNQVWRKTFGGSWSNRAHDCAVDSMGNAYFVGTTWSPSGVSYGNAHQQNFGGNTDAFLVKYDSSGTMKWATYLGGSGSEFAYHCAIDSSQNIYLAGSSTSGNAISKNGYQPRYAGNRDAFLSKFSPNGSLIWSTYYGTHQEGEHTASCAVGLKNEVYLAGSRSAGTTFYDNAFLAKYDGCLPSEVVSVSSCYSYTWPQDSVTYDSTGNYPYIIQNVAGCDSSIILDLTINDTVRASVFDTSCTSYYWPVTGNTYNASGVYEAHLTSSTTGCDSVLSLHYTRRDTVYGTKIKEVCNSFLWKLNDSTTYTQSGVYQALLPAARGCDSLVTMYLTVVDTFGLETVSACDSFYWPADSTLHFRSGIYDVVMKNRLGCDSLARLNLQINKVDTGVTFGPGSLTSNDANANYQWYLCGPSMTKIIGADQQTLNAPINASYAVVVSRDGCSDTSACYPINDVELPENPLQAGLKVFPNPTSDDVLVTMPAAYTEVEIRIFDAVGKLLRRGNYSDQKEVRLNISAKSGVFWIEVRTGSGDSARVKVIKN